MEITEEWIGKSAGWKALKAGRLIAKQNSVFDCTRKGNLFQGFRKVANKKMRLVVDVKGPFSIKNSCSCPISRSTGALCEHAVALMLSCLWGNESAAKKPASPKKDSSPAAKTSQPAIVPGDFSPLQLTFPPNLSAALHKKSVNIRIAPASNAELHPADLALASWLHKSTGSTKAPPILALNASLIASLLPALVDHPRLTAGDQPLSIRQSLIRIPVELSHAKQLTQIQLADHAHDAIYFFDSQLVVWDAAQQSLLVNEQQAGQGDSNDQSLQQLAKGNSVPIPTAQFLQMADALQMVFQLPDDLGGLKVSAAQPTFHLLLEGSTRALQARLYANYPEGKRVQIGNPKSKRGQFPISASDTEWLTANDDAELVARAQLLAAGFQLIDSAGNFVLRGENETMVFLTSTLPELEKSWQVEFHERLANINSKLARITPNIDFQGSGEDWLAFDCNWQSSDGSQIDREQIRRMLQMGQRSVKLANGKQAVLSEFDAQTMDALLYDTAPEQEDGHFIVAKNQAAYLRSLKAHYTGKSETPEVAVPALPSQLESTLRDYQKQGVEWLYQKATSDGAALLADDMGLGKTIQTLSFIQLWQMQKDQQKPALIVCPSSLLANWRDESARFTPELDVIVMHGPKRKANFELIESAQLVITSYALLARDIKQYQEIEFSTIALDEASLIRNPDTQIAKAVRKVSASSRVALSGTPIENGLRDLWSIYQFLLPGYLGAQKDFRERYEKPCSGENADPQLMQRLRWRTEPFMMRRTKDVVAKDLPAKIESVIWCEPSDSQRQTYQEILRSGNAKIDEMKKSASQGARRMAMLTTLLRLRQSCCDLRLLDKNLELELAQSSAKLTRLLELLEEAQAGDHRVIVFSQFTSMLGLIRDALEGQDIDYCYLDGATRDRDAAVKRFQKSDGPPVFLISLKAGGYGLNLTAADTVVLFDPWWNPAVEAQAADRIHRIGQTKPATIYRFATRGTVEEKILKLQEKKRAVIDATIGDENKPMMTGLSEQDLESLIG